MPARRGAAASLHPPWDAGHDEPLALESPRRLIGRENKNSILNEQKDAGQKEACAQARRTRTSADVKEMI